MLPRIIGIVGRRCVGKDTVAAHLVAKYGYDHRKFAGPLKAGLACLFDLNEDQLEGELKEVTDPRWGVSPRQIMQFFGTEVMQMKLQELMPYLGRSYATTRMFTDDDPGKGAFCISDVRFLHEVAAIKEHGGVVLRIVRPHSVGVSGCDRHISETESDMITADFVIVNSGDFAALHQDIDSLLATLTT